jgi:low temperature requirement protein LtrA
VPERFALFPLIVLGESVVAVALGTADSDWRPASAASAMLGFAAVAALWCVYFDVGAGLRVRRARAGSSSSPTSTSRFWRA